MTNQRDKLFGKFNEFALLIFGFVLSGIVGTYIAQVYTRRSSELQVATELFKDEIKLVGDRVFAMNQVFVGLQERKPESWEREEDLRKRWDAYRSEVQRWNSARAFTREMLRLYFGEETAERERTVHYALRAWGASMEKQYKIPGAVDMKCLETKRDEILSMTHEFGFSLAEAIRAGNLRSVLKQRAFVMEKSPMSIFCTTQDPPPSPQLEDDTNAESPF